MVVITEKKGPLKERLEEAKNWVIQHDKQLIFAGGIVAGFVIDGGLRKIWNHPVALPDGTTRIIEYGKWNDRKYYFDIFSKNFAGKKIRRGDIVIPFESAERIRDWMIDDLAVMGQIIAEEVSE